MTFVAIPKEATADSAGVWVATDEGPPAGPMELRHSGKATPLGARWEAWHRAGDARSLHHQLVSIQNLPPRTSEPFLLKLSDQTVAAGRLTTLPDRLPETQERPLTFLLGSCFYNSNDPEGRVESAYDRLPPSHRPDFKILCGDQIYLDSPWTHFLRKRHTERELRAHFFDRYWQTWAGARPGPGMRRVLSDGANFFSADDHELWNNAPNRATVVLDSWTENGRNRWRHAALSLYRAFQTANPWTRFDVPPLSFYVADTRMHRDADEKRFMTDTALQNLTTWLRSLRGPGVLVLGQPIFDEPRDLRGHFTDWGLPDYEQYAVLVRALYAAPHSVLVLTGDVHYRRIARCRLTTEHELFEVIASPLSLVDKKAGGSWHAAPDRFPAAAVPGAPTRSVFTAEPLRSHQDHFLLFQCRKVASSVRVEIFDFSVDPAAPTPGPARPVAKLRLH